MYGENTKTIAIPIYRVLPYPVITRIDQHMKLMENQIEFTDAQGIDIYKFL